MAQRVVAGRPPAASGRPDRSATGSSPRPTLPDVARGVRKATERLIGRWRIVEMGMWDREAIDEIEPGFIEFTADGTGRFGFIAVRGEMDCRASGRDGRDGVEFTWEGDDEGDRVSGRGWAAPIDDAVVEGRLFFHLGDDSSFRAEPFGAVDRDGAP